MTGNFRRMLVAYLVLVCAFSLVAAVARADERPWIIEKSSGDVWITRDGADPVSIDLSGGVKPGDDIRTGRNGRVMLSRGEERIMVQPNSAIAIPAQQTGQYATTIQQQAGTIMLQVEKKNVQHFEVETPYLAAVVKGTQFRVSVDARGAAVDVVEGHVQVADFKTGQNVMVDPGQRAAVNTAGKAGLSLSGSGKLNAIETGAPRITGVRAMAVPRGGLTAPARAGAIAASAANFDASDLGMKDIGTKAFAKATSGATKFDGAGATNFAVGEGKSVSKKKSTRTGVSNAVRAMEMDGSFDGRGVDDASLSVYSNSAAATAFGAATPGVNLSGSNARTSPGGTVGTAVSNVGGTVGVVGNAVGGAASGAGNSVGSTVSGLGNTVGGTVGGVGNLVGGSVGNTVGGVGNTVSGTTNVVGGLLGNGNGNGNAYGNNGGNGIGNALGLLKK